MVEGKLTSSEAKTLRIIRRRERTYLWRDDLPDLEGQPFAYESTEKVGTIYVIPGVSPGFRVQRVPIETPSYSRRDEAHNALQSLAYQHALFQLWDDLPIPNLYGAEVLESAQSDPQVWETILVAYLEPTDRVPVKALGENLDDSQSPPSLIKRDLLDTMSKFYNRGLSPEYRWNINNTFYWDDKRGHFEVLDPSIDSNYPLHDLQWPNCLIRAIPMWASIMSELPGFVRDKGELDHLLQYQYREFTNLDKGELSNLGGALISLKSHFASFSQ